MKKYSVVLALVLLISSDSTALAHKPIFVEAASNTAREMAARIPNPEISWAIYAQLSQAAEVNYYSFDGKRDARVKIDVSIPRIDSERDFGVMVALIGGGLPDAYIGAPIAVNAGEGAIIAPDLSHDPSRVFDEPFTQTSYWTRQSLVAQLPQDGPYTIAVWNSRGQRGRYVIAIGEREEFGIADLADFPRTWIKVHAFFREAGSDFENAFGVLFVGTITLVVGRVIERRFR